MGGEKGMHFWRWEGGGGVKERGEGSSGLERGVGLAKESWEREKGGKKGTGLRSGLRDWKSGSREGLGMVHACMDGWIGVSWGEWSATQ